MKKITKGVYTQITAGYFLTHDLFSVLRLKSWHKISDNNVCFMWESWVFEFKVFLVPQSKQTFILKLRVFYYEVNWSYWRRWAFRQCLLHNHAYKHWMTRKEEIHLVNCL